MVKKEKRKISKKKIARKGKTKKIYNTRERLSTGIKGFDELIQGGFPQGSTILVSGGAGTGKTIFGLSYLYAGAKNFNEPGLYITLAR